MDGAVNDEASRVNPIVGGVEDHVAVEVDLDQARRIDLFVEHAIGIDQEMVVRSGNAAGDVVGDHLGHAVDRREPIAGREVDAGLPLLGAHLFAN